MARMRGKVAMELIENDRAESYSFEPAKGYESEELEESRYRLEKRPRREDTEVD